MTEFAPSNLPAGIGTVEELFVWAASILSELNAAATVATGQGRVEPPASMQTYRFPLQIEAPERIIVVGYVPLTATWRGVPKLWNGGIAELSEDAIPALYTSDN